MLNAAERYFELGANVLPVGLDKRPLCTWRRWNDKRQTKTEFESLPWNQASGFAVILGTLLDNASYFGVVDFDVKNLPQETVEKGRHALKAFKVTQLERTPSGGQHLVYFARKLPRTEKSQHSKCSLELLGQGCFCLMSPSPGYTRLNDNAPTEIDDINEAFRQALATVGIYPRDRFDTKNSVQTSFAMPRTFKTLSNKEEEKVVQFLCKYWRQGVRNRLELFFLGLCVKRGVSLESSKRIIAEVAARTNDAETASRLELVDYHYRTRLSGRLKGSSGIREIIEESR